MKKAIISFLVNSLLVLTAQIDLNSQSNPDTTDVVKLKWINFSPYTEIGQNPNQGSVIPESQIISLLDSLKPWVEGIRTFGTQNGLENVPYLAKERGFNVIVGIWLGRENTPAGILTNSQQIANGIAIANAGYADRLIVGSEVLYRGDLTASKLIEYIDEVKSATNVPVSCADVYSKLIENPEVADAGDFVSPNIYPFWEGMPIECAMQSFHQSYLSLLPVANGKEIFISESGWKTTGNPVRDAMPSIENAIQYLLELLGWSRTFEVDVNIFAAFDEPWKQPNDDGWGVFYSNGEMKPGMDTIFTGFEIIDSTWICSSLDNQSSDTLYIDFIPSIGSFSNVRGHVDHLNPCEYKIATYIKVGSGWWTKPTFANPTVPILCNGNWVVDYTTGGMDQSATDICIFVVPSDYFPPPCGGCSAIPASIYQNAIDWECIHRYTLPTAALVASSDTICRGDSITLTASGGEYYNWSTGDTTSSITILPTSSPYVSYSVEITDGMGGGTVLSKNILVIDPSLYMAIAPIIICKGDSSRLIAYSNSPFTTLTEFLWSTGETNDTIYVTPETTTTYSVTVTTAEGCTVSTARTVHVDYPSSAASAFPDTICLGGSASVFMGGGVSYIWSTGATSSSIHVSPTTTTIYSVTITTNNGCTKTSQDTVFVSPLPVVTVSAYPDTICRGDTALLVATGGPPYNWFSIQQTTDSVYVSPNFTKTYKVSVTNEAGCSSQASTILTVANNFSLSISTAPDTIQIGGMSTLTVNGDPGITFLWSTGDTTPSIQVSPAITTTYSVTARNTGGCIKTDSVIVTVISNVSTGNFDKIKSVKIYPRPANAMFRVELKVNDAKYVEISLLDELGQVLQHRREIPVLGEIISLFDVASLPAGLYFLKLTTENGETWIEKAPILK
jgi:exo-beta-1,3-glucanase (GH17 family)